MINGRNLSSNGSIFPRYIPLLGGTGHRSGNADGFLHDVAIDFCMNCPLSQKESFTEKSAHQIHVAALVINDPGMLVHPTFFKTIISTMLSPGELLLMLNKSVDNVKFLNEDDNSVVPPGCHYAIVLIITVSSPGLFCEPGKSWWQP